MDTLGKSPLPRLMGEALLSAASFDLTACRSAISILSSSALAPRIEPWRRRDLGSSRDELAYAGDKRPPARMKDRQASAVTDTRDIVLRPTVNLSAVELTTSPHICRPRFCPTR